jgi:hypothetical protein
MRALAQRTAFAVAASLGLLTSAAQAETCWYPQEAKAAQLRDFHIMLMVGTLQCRTSSPITVRDYNAFVNRQSLVLDTNKHLLRDHFLRDVGPGNADSAYDSYSTMTANTVQPRMVADPNLCARMDTLARVAAVANLADLMVLAQTFETRQFSNVCPASTYPVAEDGGALPAAVSAGGPIGLTAASATPPPPPLAVPDNSPPPSDKADWGDAAAPAPAVPAPAPVVAQAPIAAKEVAASEAPGATSDPATMKAAIVALQAAVAALQAASGPTAAHVGTTTLHKTTAEAAKPELIAVKVQEAPIIPPPE